MDIPYTEHYKITIRGIDTDKIAVPAEFRILAEQYAKTLGVSVVQDCLHKFPGQGITYIQILEESHLAYHTWPEREFMLIDLLTCTELNKTTKEIAQLTEQVFEAKSVEVNVLN